MKYGLRFWAGAAETVKRLGADPTQWSTLRALRRTLARLQREPSDRTLGTRYFKSGRVHHIRATPLGVADWHIYWLPGGEPQTIEIVHIAETAP